MKRKVQKGFTLVELIVVMILMGVLMTAVVMILRPSQNTFKNVTNKAYEEQISLNISKLLNGSLRYATGVKIICNDGTKPADTDIGKHKRYIKLSNTYRTTSVKGARGDFERGTVEGSGLKKLASAVNSNTFDEYDFQFFIAGFNSKDEEASLTIGLRAMPMEPSTPDEETIATGIKKPNPGFVPNWEKYYDYSETFEFINIRHKKTISKETLGISVEDYEKGPYVVGLGSGKAPDGFVNPLSKDNTIWIFYTNPQEADAASSTGGGGSSSKVAGTSSEEDSTEYAGPDSSSTVVFDMSTPASSSESSSEASDDTSIASDSKPSDDTSVTESSSVPDSSSSEADSSSKTDVFGSVELVFIGAPYDNGKQYNFSNSGMKVSSTVGEGNISVTKSGTISIDGAASSDYTSFSLYCPAGGGVSMGKSEMKDQPARTFYLYNGKNYGEGEAARIKAQDDHDKDASTAPYTLSVTTTCDERNPDWDKDSGGHSTHTIKVRVDDGFVPAGTIIIVNVQFDKSVNMSSIYSGGTGSISGDTGAFNIKFDNKTDKGSEKALQFNVLPSDCNIVSASIV